MSSKPRSDMADRAKETSGGDLRKKKRKGSGLELDGWKYETKCNAIGRFIRIIFFWLIANSLLWHPIQFWIEQGCAQNKHLINCCCWNFRNVKRNENKQNWAISLQIHCNSCTNKRHKIFDRFKYPNHKNCHYKQAMKMKRNRESKRKIVCPYYCNKLLDCHRFAFDMLAKVVYRKKERITSANILFDTHKCTKGTSWDILAVTP